MTPQAQAPTATLNGFLEVERSAVLAYTASLRCFEEGTPVRAAVEECLQAHETNMRRLEETIVALGEEPGQGTGAWGKLFTLLEEDAARLGPKVAIAVLEEGEDRGLRGYERVVGRLQGATRTLVETELLPTHERTHRTMSDLKSALLE